MNNFLCFIFSFLFFFGFVEGGAFRLSEVCTTDMGVASAGAAAVARDVGTAYFNPAGLTRLDCTELQVGGEIFIADVMFDKSDESLFRGGNGGQAGVVLPLLGTYFHSKISDRLHLGLAVNSPYGGTYNYGRDWVGRYYNQRVFIATLAFNPSIAYHINKWLSVGAGIVGQFGYLNQAIALNPIVVGGNPITDPDGRLKLNLDNWAWGYNLGVLLELSPCTRFGVTYRSQINHDFSGRAEVIPSGFEVGIDTKLELAQWVVASFFHQFSARIAFMGSVGWDDWSALKRTVLVSDNGGTFTIPRDWQDTWHGALGLEYTLCSPVTLQAGISYDSSPTRARSRTPDLPMDRQWRFGTGLIWKCNSCEKLSAAVEYAYAGKAPINSIKEGTEIMLLKGDYRHNNLIFINFTYQRKL